MQVSAAVIQKYNGRSKAWLKNKATEAFNRYIRLRDTNENGYGMCISSGRTVRWGVNLHAGHFYAAGHYETLRYNEDNVHAQSHSDNTHKSGNLLEYRKRLLAKIGAERMAALERKAAMDAKAVKVWDRLSLINVIEVYRAKAKAMATRKNFVA